MEPEDEKWISEASDAEKLYELAHKRGCFLLVYQLSLSSKQPIQEEHVQTTLIHMQRKFPALRICYGQRDGKTWLRYMNKEEIDFKVVKDAGPEDVREHLHTYQYNSREGPLWCVRLLSDTAVDSLAIDKELPYTSQIFFGVHHGITDGLSMLKICGGFIKILNEVIGKKTICDKEQVGYFISDTKTENLLPVKMSTIEQDLSLKQEITSTLEEKGIGMPLLFKVEPPPEGEDKTCNLCHVLDEEKTKKFIGKCKTEGVALQSAFAALVNASLLTFLLDKDFVQNSYKMNNGHVINLRRYWPGESVNAMGCHAHAPLNLWADVPSDLNGKFWNLARSIHQDLHHHLKKETILWQEACLKLCSSGEPDFDEIFHREHPAQVDCVLSNLGDVTSFFSDGCGGPYVKPYLLRRHLSLHRTNIKNFTHFFHTFRGRLILNLLHNSKYISKDVAQKHCVQVFSILDQVINGILK